MDSNEVNVPRRPVQLPSGIRHEAEQEPHDLVVANPTRAGELRYERVLAKLVEKNGVGKRTDGASPPAIDDLDDAVEVGFRNATRLHEFPERADRMGALSHALPCAASGSFALDGPRAVRHTSRVIASPRLLIAPSILSADFGRLADEVEAVERAGADWIHVDVMDGRFVPNLTLGPLIVRAVRKATRLPVDVHLMIVEPERYVDAFADAGADVISVHVEASPHLHRTLQQIRGLGRRAGVALNPSTSEETVRYVLSLVDLVLVMSVNPGFGGQAFLPEVLPKIRALRQMLDTVSHPVDIEVDGGIGADTAPLVREAGANVLVAGNAVFTKPPYDNAIMTLRQNAERSTWA